jgi:hypothetical protein
MLILYSVVIGYGRLCGLVVRVPGCRSRGPGSIPGANGFSALADERKLYDQ